MLDYDCANSYFKYGHEDIFRLFISNQGREKSAMYRLSLFVAASSAIVLTSSPASAQNPHRYSLHRLSLSFASTYYFNPWNNYNDALSKVAGRIRLDPYFVEPQGYYEEINGDLAFQGALSYMVTGRVAAHVAGQYGQSSARFEFYPEPGKIPEFVFGTAFHQNLDWSIWSIGVGASYQFPLRRGVNLKISASAERYTAHLDLAWRHSYFADGPLPEGDGVGVQANLQDQTWGGSLAVAVQWQLAGPLALLAGASYRFAQFDDLKGPAVYNDSNLANGPFTAELVEASNYFGLRIKEQPAGDYSIILPPLTFLTSPDENARLPATIDLNSFGLTLGLQIGF
jgi:hypothetical protein